MSIPNDGSVSGSPCHKCSGRLVLRPMRNGSFFLGCSHFKDQDCTFTMSPNADELTRLDELRAEAREARLARQAEKDAAEREKAEARRREEDVSCVGCGEVLTTVRKFAKAKFCSRCERVEALRLQCEVGKQ